MLRRLFGSELLDWRSLRTEQVLTIIGASMILFLALCFVNASLFINSLVHRTASDFSLQVYWQADADISRIQRQWDQIAERAEVHSLSTFTPDEALQGLQDNLGQDISLSSLIARNPLPPTLVLRAKMGKKLSAQSLIRDLEALPLVAKVQMNPLEVHLAGTWKTLTTTVLWPLLLAFVAILAWLMANTLRLGLIDLQEDIQVLRLIGASRWTYLSPLFSRTLALTLSSLTLALFALKVVQIRVDVLLSSPPLDLSFPFLPWSMILCAYVLTASVSILSCTLAIRRHGL